MPDAIFDHPRVARVYDPMDPVRRDLDSYVDVVGEFGATSVLDVGCGTGTLACRLADRNVRVLGVDPAAASVAIARTKAASERVRWVVGTMVDVVADPGHRGSFDLATMSANVAQVFLGDAEWKSTLDSIRSCLRPGGRLVFEARRPADRGWERWTREMTREIVEIPGEGPVESWVQVTAIDGELVTFDSPTIFLADGERIESTSTLRFRTEGALRDSHHGCGLHRGSGPGSSLRAGSGLVDRRGHRARLTTKPPRNGSWDPLRGGFRWERAVSSVPARSS